MFATFSFSFYFLMHSSKHSTIRLHLYASRKKNVVIYYIDMCTAVICMTFYNNCLRFVSSVDLISHEYLFFLLYFIFFGKHILGIILG